MKAQLLSYSLLLILIACSNASIKKERSVSFDKLPKLVADSFTAHHPGMTPNFHIQNFADVETYEAHFQIEEKEISERYSSNGEIMETEKVMDWKELPENVRQNIEIYLKDHDGKYKVLKVQEVKSSGFSGYEVNVRTKKSRTHLMEYFFNKDGSINHQEEVQLKSIPTLN